MKYFSLLVLFMLVGNINVFAQSPAPVVVPQNVGFIAAHGGLQASLILLVLVLNIVLSAVRDVLASLDGVPKGGVIPEDKAALSLVNKVCIFLGKIIDYVQGNVQH